VFVVVELASVLELSVVLVFVPVSIRRRGDV